jgi:hypothetical protein
MAETLKDEFSSANESFVRVKMKIWEEETGIDSTLWFG